MSAVNARRYSTYIIHRPIIIVVIEHTSNSLISLFVGIVVFKDVYARYNTYTFLNKSWIRLGFQYFTIYRKSEKINHYNEIPDTKFPGKGLRKKCIHSSTRSDKYFSISRCIENLRKWSILKKSRKKGPRKKVPWKRSPRIKNSWKKSSPETKSPEKSPLEKKSPGKKVSGKNVNETILSLFTYSVCDEKVKKVYVQSWGER